MQNSMNPVNKHLVAMPLSRNCNIKIYAFENIHVGYNLKNCATITASGFCLVKKQSSAPHGKLLLQDRELGTQTKVQTAFERKKMKICSRL